MFAFAVVLATISTTLPQTLVRKEVQNGDGKKIDCSKTRGTRGHPFRDSWTLSSPHISTNALVSFVLHAVAAILLFWVALQSRDIASA